jgi:YNFM family putative membrane transporter
MESGKSGSGRLNADLDREAEHDPGAGRRISVGLFLGGFATFSLLYCTQPLLPDFARQFHVDAATSSLAVSLTTGALAISIMFAGAVSEAVGRRGLMFACLLAAALLNLFCAFAPGWTALLVARGAEGVVLGGVPAVGMAYLAEEVAPSRLGAAMGLYIGGNAFGGMVGRVAVGVLTHAFSWRVALGVISVADLAAALVFIGLLPRSRRFERRPGFDLVQNLAGWGRHLRQPRMLLLFLTGFLAMSAFVTIYNYAGFRLSAPPYRLNPTQVGLIFLVYILGIFAASAAGAMADRIGRAPVMATGAACALAGVGLTVLHPLPAIVAGIAVVTVGFFVVHSVASAWVGRLAGRDKGHAASLYLLAYYAGASVMGSIGGAVWRDGGWGAVSAYAGAMLLGIVAIASLMGRDEGGPRANPVQTEPSERG